MKQLKVMLCNHFLIHFFSALSIFKVANELLFICKGGDQQSIKRFQLLCKVILLNLETEKDAKVSLLVKQIK